MNVVCNSRKKKILYHDTKWLKLPDMNKTLSFEKSCDINMIITRVKNIMLFPKQGVESSLKAFFDGVIKMMGTSSKLIQANVKRMFIA